MAWVKTTFSELVSLFVEDGSLAVAILAWLGLTGLVLARFESLSSWRGMVLFAGLAAILVENTWRRARADRGK
ncbi:MAG: hypothetical protein JO137_11540 [Hyphomicrobiales bacterium]|nr:hypothetical protein [Hyphomicrobiales bacterium]MBV9432445.1 hypothetical protein [Hyphomicrobiales bacterium]MBV9738837.1 hypothetical protein [Hyphomicrobiales bacterium]